MLILPYMYWYYLLILNKEFYLFNVSESLAVFLWNPCMTILPYEKSSIQRTLVHNGRFFVEPQVSAMNRFDCSSIDRLMKIKKALSPFYHKKIFSSHLLKKILIENFIFCVVVCVSIVKINFQTVAPIIDNPFLFRNETDRDGVLLFK